MDWARVLQTARRVSAMSRTAAGAIGVLSEIRPPIEEGNEGRGVLKQRGPRQYENHT